VLKVPLTLIKQPTYLERLPFKKLIVLLQIKLNSVTVDFTAFFFWGGGDFMRFRKRATIAILLVL